MKNTLIGKTVTKRGPTNSPMGANIVISVNNRYTIEPTARPTNSDHVLRNFTKFIIKTYSIAEES